MLNLWRKAMMGQGKAEQGLPEGYTAVNAIKRQGNWWYLQNLLVDKQFNITDIRKVEISMRGNTANNGPMIWGYDNQIALAWNWFFQSGYNKDHLTMTPSLTKTEFEQLTDFTTMVFETDTAWGTNNNTKDIYILSRANWAFKNFSFQYCKVWDKNGNLMADLRPCIRNTDNAVGYYDLVTEQFRYRTESYAVWAVDTNP